MASYEFKLPAMGEGIIEATITRWFVKPGDTVAEDDLLVEVATDKVDSEIPSPVDGTVKEILFEEEQTPAVGEVIMLLEVEGEEEASASEASTKKEVATSRKTPVRAEIKEQANNLKVSDISPLIVNMASERGIELDELRRMEGSGHEGSITKEDLNKYILAGRPFKQTEPFISKVEEIKITTGKNPKATDQITLPADGNYDIIEMSRMRQIIANHMLESVHRSPHVTSFVEADVTEMVIWRNGNKDRFLEKHGEKLTYTTMFFEIVAKALVDFPAINISVFGNQIIQKHDINIGMATALTDGNLIVPVIKNADKLNMAGLAARVNHLSEKARGNKLQPVDTKDGTFTVTNVGNFDNLTGTPIINQPEVAILALGAIKRKPAVVNTPQGETLGIRSIVMLALSYDHRVVDGALGGTFLRRVQKYAEEFDARREV